MHSPASSLLLYLASEVFGLQVMQATEDTIDGSEFNQTLLLAVPRVQLNRSTVWSKSVIR